MKWIFRFHHYNLLNFELRMHTQKLNLLILSSRIKFFKVENVTFCSKQSQTPKNVKFQISEFCKNHVLFRSVGIGNVFLALLDANARFFFFFLSKIIMVELKILMNENENINLKTDTIVSKNRGSAKNNKNVNINYDPDTGSNPTKTSGSTANSVNCINIYFYWFWFILQIEW